MALVEGNTHGGAPANDQQNEQDGAPAIPDAAVAQMLGHVSDRASVQGGKVIDIAEVFIQAIAGEDTFVGEQEYVERTGNNMDGLVDAVRQAASDEGVDVDDKRVHLRLVEEIEQQKNASGWAEGNMAWVQDYGGETSHMGEDTDEWVTRAALHEAAHSLLHDVDDGGGHGDLWQRVYLGALERVMPHKVAEERERMEVYYASE